MLTEIQDQTQSLTEISSDYRTQLKEGRESAREESTALSENMEKIQKSQAELAEILNLLIEQIEKQCQQATSQAEADEWALLRRDADQQNTSLSELKNKTSEGLGTASDAAKNLSNLSGGNRQLDALGSRLGGASGVIQSFGKVFGGFLSKKEPPSQSQTSTPTRRPLPQSAVSHDTKLRTGALVHYGSIRPAKSIVVNCPPPPQRRHTLAQTAPGFASSDKIMKTPPPLPPRTPPSTAFSDTVEPPPLPPRVKSPPSLPPKPIRLNVPTPPPTPDVAKPASSPKRPQVGQTRALSPTSNQTISTESLGPQAHRRALTATSIPSSRAIVSRPPARSMDSTILPVSVVPRKPAGVTLATLASPKSPETMSFAEKQELARKCIAPK